MQAGQKITILRQQRSDTLPLDDPDFLMDLRRSLRQMLAVIEKKLRIERNKCRRCGHVLSE